MGYYTEYEISVTGTNGIEEDLIESRIQQISGYTGLSFKSTCNCKWYDMKEDMQKVTLEFPQVTFFVEGNGEEQGDIWKAVFKNGKYKIVKPLITWPDLSLD